MEVMMIIERDKHRVFISFYHEDDQKYKNYIDYHLSDNIINESVVEGEYDSNNSDEYIKALIRDEKISPSSVIVVLVGPHTKERKHVDWEIYAGLRESINGRSGLVGILLPEYDEDIDELPARLKDNVDSGYADLYCWEDAIYYFDKIIEDAFNRRIEKKDLADNTRKQKQYNI